jgi:hypothetical protein
MVRIAKRKIDPRQVAAKAQRPIEPMAYSIAEFCEAHGISVDMYFRMGRDGFGPQTMKVGARTLVSHEAAARWRLEREAAHQSAPAAKPMPAELRERVAFVDDRRRRGRPEVAARRERIAGPGPIADPVDA